MVNELAPLHDHHGELFSVVALVLVDHGADEPRVGQRTVTERPPHLLNTVTVIRWEESRLKVLLCLSV